MFRGRAWSLCWLRTLARLTGKDSRIKYPLGLEVDGEPVLKPYAPPYYPSMREAVLAVVEGVGFQASHDLDFYARHYRPEALGETQRQHMHHWHGDPAE